jgi:tungstate transport system ATP-binding protein
MNATASVLELRDVKVERGGVQVLDIPSFRLHDGEFASLIGPNGSGKSTLLLCLMGLLRRSAGRLFFKGEEIASDRAALECRRRIAMVLQEPLLFDATVHENVASGLKIRGLPRREVRRRVLTYLERFNLAHMGDRSARKLSGGEARRVSLARALAVEPDVIFLDEPFANLDAPTRQSIIEDLERTIRERRIAAMLVTHDQAEALRLSDRLVVMSGGRIIQADTPQAVMYSCPANEFIASFVGMETILEGVVARASGGLISVSVAGTEVQAVGEASPGERVYCCIRPENVIIDVVSNARTTSARNVFAVRIGSISPHGPYLKVRLDGAFPLVAFVTAESFTELRLEVGKEVFASFKATALHVIRRGDPGRRAT